MLWTKGQDRYEPTLWTRGQDRYEPNLDKDDTRKIIGTWIACTAFDCLLIWWALKVVAS